MAATEEQILAETMRIAEKFFGTLNDPEQIPITQASVVKLRRLHPAAFHYLTDEAGEHAVGWIVVVPTTKVLMRQFLEGRMTERQLFDQTVPQNRYDALYLCAAFVLPEYRRQGLATKLFKDSLKAIPLTHDAELFAWPTTPEGKAMAEKMIAEGHKIQLRK